MAYDLEAMLVRITGWNDDLNAGFATMREMKVMTGTVDDISPSINNATLAINYRLVEIETI